MRKLLQSAIEMHRAGLHADAAVVYRQILDEDPENVEALHWFGLMHHQAGDHAAAITLIRRAVELSSESYLYHGSLGEAQAAAGDHASAEGSFGESLRLWPEYATAWCGLGTSLTALKRFDEAIEALSRAIELRPDFAVAINNLGVAFRERGDLTRATVEFRRAVGIAPSFAPAHANVGLALLAQDLTAEALEHCRKAVELDPNSPEIHDNLGTVLRRLDRLDDAWNEHWIALRLDPNLASANAHIGLILQQRGHLDEALPWLDKAVELNPDSPALWRWLAELHDESNEPERSIACWRKVLALQPNQVSTLLALGRALQDEGQFDEARECYVAALLIEPDSVTAQLNVGSLHELLGVMDQAENAYRTAIRLQPSLPIPHARLATLLRGKLSDEDLNALEQRLADPGIEDVARGRLLFALAHVLDARGDFVRAAECLALANSCPRELSKERIDYLTRPHEEFISGLIRGFDRDLFSRLSGAGLESQRPVFIFGLPRSGTTLIEQVLASHSQFHGAGELKLARRTFDTMPTVVGQARAPLECLALLDEASIKALADAHLQRLEEIDSGRSPRIVDKMPDNYLYVGLLAVLFPRATFIHCRRELRDVAVSCWMTDFSTIRWANKFEHIAARFQQYRRIMNHWNRVLPVQVHHVDYEESVSDLPSVAARLLMACGCDWEPACLDFHRTERPVRTASITQVRQPIYNRSVARWRHYEPALADLFAALPIGDEPFP